MTDDDTTTPAVSAARETAPWVPCSECGAIVAFVPAVLEAYLVGVSVPCPRCKRPNNWWRSVLVGVREHFHFGAVMAMAGCRTILLQVEVPAGTTVEVNLAEHGVAEDAEIVKMNLTPNGGTWAHLAHGNEAIRDPVGPRFSLFGQRFPGENEDQGNAVSIMATWFVRRGDDTVIRHLVDAARHYHAERFDALVVPANVAAEASLTPVLTQFFERYAGKGQVEEMLENGATYSHQLNVLMNVAAEVLGVPRLHDQIRGLLNRLRKLRNEIAHEGRCAEQSRAVAAEHLAAVFFLVRYAKVLSLKLEGNE